MSKTHTFLSISTDRKVRENKSELFCLLAKSIEDGIVYASYNETSICNKFARQQIPCTHEEADTRIFVHLKNAIERDCISSACIMCNDTDIVILDQGAKLRKTTSRAIIRKPKRPRYSQKKILNDEILLLWF